MHNLWALIMAGGSGERLWPLSRRQHPKQTLRFGTKGSLLQVTLERLKEVVPSRRIVVVTTKNQAELVRRQLREIPKAHFLVEPASRNTAAAIGLGTVAIMQEDPDAVVVVAPADHIIRPPEEFAAIVKKAASLAIDRQGLVCLGIRPTYPATGFGYIEPMGALVSSGGYRVRRFIEKPPLSVARRLLKRSVFWNSGIFCWQGRVILSSIRQWLPGLWTGLEAMRRGWGTQGGSRRLGDLYRGLPTVSIDVGVLERSRHVWMVPTRFSWDDVGSWNSLSFLHGTDPQGNVILGPHVGLSTSSSIVVAGKRLVATIGIRDLIIVDSPDALLVCPKTQAQEVRKLVAQLSANRSLRKYL